MNTKELQAKLEEVTANIRTLSELDEITPEQDAELSDLVNGLEPLEAQIAQSVKNDRIVARVKDGTAKPTSVDGAPNVNIAKDPHEVDARTAPLSEIRDAAKRLIDSATHLTPDQQSAALTNMTGVTKNRDGNIVARQIVASERPEYHDAFMKFLAGRDNEWTESQRVSVGNFKNAMSQTTTAGGFGIPSLIDPTVLITDGTGLTGILAHARIETITNDAWRGVSAGNTAWSFDAEAAEVSDDTSTFAQPTVTAHMARGYIPYSIEIGEDYPGFATEMGRLLSDGYMDLLAENLMVGSGSDAPFGIFATTTTKVDVTTDNTFGAEDIDAVWAAVPEKFRARSVWVMNVDVENDIRGFGSGTATSRFTVDQTREGISLLNGKAVVLSDYAPTWTGTDGANILAVGDPGNFLVAQRTGMVIEPPFLVQGTTNGRPTGERGLFAHARVGSDIVVQNAWRLLKNITT